MSRILVHYTILLTFSSVSIYCRFHDSKKFYKVFSMTITRNDMIEFDAAFSMTNCFVRLVRAKFYITLTPFGKILQCPFSIFLILTFLRLDFFYIFILILYLYLCLICSINDVSSDILPLPIHF